MVPPSFIEEATEHWRAAPGESLDNTLGAHAMAIVGYDDHINGGSFLIANSWGKNWGQDGYTWANYDDMIRFIRHAYQVFPEPHAVAKPGTITLKGAVDFDLNSGQMPVQTVLTRGLDRHFRPTWPWRDGYLQNETALHIRHPFQDDDP